MANINLNKVDKWISYLSIFLILVLILVLTFYISMFNGGFSKLHSNWGEFGDFFGGIVGTLISLFAVILLYFTYRLQRIELAKSTEALNNQNEQLNIQQFENIVFKLLERKDEVLNRLEFKNQQGIPAIKQLNLALRQENIKVNDDEDQIDMKTLNKWWNTHKSYLWPYFNSVVSAINFIQTYKVSDVIRYRLVQIYFTNFTLEEIRMVDNIFKIHVGDPSIVQERIFFEQNASSILKKL